MQKQASGDAKKPARHAAANLFSGLLNCEVCLHSVTAHENGRCERGCPCTVTRAQAIEHNLRHER